MKDLIENIRQALQIINTNRHLNITLVDQNASVIGEPIPVGVSRFEHIDSCMQFIKNSLAFTSPATGVFYCRGFNHADLLVSSYNQTALNHIQGEILSEYSKHLKNGSMYDYLYMNSPKYTMAKIAKALKILKDHKHLELFINSFELCSIPDAVSLGDKKLLRFQLLTTVDPHEELRIDYVVPSDDIEGHTDKVNKYVGNISMLDKDLQEDLRLAWLIYNGYKYAISKDVKLNSDFLPRVVNYYRRVML